MPRRNTDPYSLEAIRSGRVIVDVENGIITRPSGKRAEHLDKRLGYGRVWVCKSPAIFAMAHRVVWLAAHGKIPPGLQVNHINGTRFDNRIANLELVTPQGNNLHWRGRVYDGIGRGGNVDAGWLERLDTGLKPDPDQERRDPFNYRRMRHGREYLLS